MCRLPLLSNHLKKASFDVPLLDTKNKPSCYTCLCMVVSSTPSSGHITKLYPSRNLFRHLSTPHVFNQSTNGSQVLSFILNLGMHFVFLIQRNGAGGEIAANWCLWNLPSWLIDFIRVTLVPYTSLFPANYRS